MSFARDLRDRGHGQWVWKAVMAGALAGVSGLTAGCHSFPPKPGAGNAVFQDCSECPPMVVIPAGNFLMGATGPEDEIPKGEPLEPHNTPRHRVTFKKPFALGQHEVTRTEFAAFVDATHYQTPSRCSLTENISQVIEGRNWAYPTSIQYSDDEPVLCTGYYDEVAYAEWLTQRTGYHYRLPSEAEWEYAARAGTTTRWFWGDSGAQGCLYSNSMERNAALAPSIPFVVPSTACSNHPQYANPNKSPVKAYLPNPWGLYGMVGNGWEMVEDCWHQDFTGAPTDGSTWIRDGDCHSRTIRDPGGPVAGNWASISHRYAALADEHRSNGHVFRVARDL